MSRRGWVLFVALSLVWGLPYLLIKVAVEEVSPTSLVFLRCASAAALLVPYALAKGQLGAVVRHWRPVLLFTVLEMTGPWLLIAYAEQDLSSSLTGLLVAVVPIVAAVASRLSGDDDRLDRVRLVGMLVGIAGVVCLLGLDVGGGQLLAVGAVGLVVLGYGTAPLVVTRSLADVPGAGLSAAALLLTALFYAPFAVGDLVRAPLPSGEAVSAVAALSLVCTVAALLLFFALIREVGPQRALVITFVNPAVAVLLGVVVLDEPLTVGVLVGFPLVLLGCVLATRRARAAVPDQPAGEPLVVEPARR